MIHPRRRAVLPLLAVLLALTVRAHADPDDEEAGWTTFVPPTAPGTVVAPTTPEGGFGSSDRTRFDEQLRSRVLDQLCRQLKINQEFGFGSGDFSGNRVGAARYLATYSDGTLAVVDDEKLRAAFGHSFAKNVAEQAGATVGVSFSASIEGHTMVIRRLNTKQSCDEVGRLLNFADIKTVFPMTGRRISEMQLGELWRLPFTLTYSQGVSVNDTPVVDTVASLSFGRGDTGTSSMTLFRLADDKVRFRFRIDHVVVYSKTAGVHQTIPAIPFAADAHNILLRFLEKEVARQFERYTSAWITYGRASSDGARILMEFTVDPRDPEQAEAMARAMRGDIEELVRMGVRMSTLHADDATALKDYERLRDKHAETLGEPSYAASDDYRAKTRNFSFNLPLIVSHNVSKLFGDDRYTRYTGEEGEYQFYRSDKTKSNEFLNMPWVGPLVKANTQRDVEAVTYAPKGGTHGDPIVVYIRNEGYLRIAGSSVRDDVREMNEVLALTGAARGKATGKIVLPVETLVPLSPITHSDGGPHGQPHDSEPSDRKGMISLTMVFNQQAVRDILAAPQEAVLKAFARTVDPDDRQLAEWLATHATVNAKGELEYSWREVRAAFPDDFNRRPQDGGRDRSGTLSDLSKKAAGLLADIAAGRDAADNQARAQALAVMIGGKGRSGMAYEETLKVLVQFVDPLDLTGDFVANVSASTKGVHSPNQHLVLRDGHHVEQLVAPAGAIKGRFGETLLTD